MNSETPRNYRYYDLLMALFVTVLLISNLLSSAKIIDLKASLGPIALAFRRGDARLPDQLHFRGCADRGLRLQALAARDLGRVWRERPAGLFRVVCAAALPSDPIWQQTWANQICDAAGGCAGSVTAAADASYDGILGGISGLIVASLVAYFLGEFSNSYVLAKMKVHDRGALAVDAHHRQHAGRRRRRYDRVHADRDGVGRLPDRVSCCR